VVRNPIVVFIFLDVNHEDDFITDAIHIRLTDVGFADLGGLMLEVNCIKENINITVDSIVIVLGIIVIQSDLISICLEIPREIFIPLKLSVYLMRPQIAHPKNTGFAEGPFGEALAKLLIISTQLEEGIGAAGGGNDQNEL
jgi:hypothetical protein